MGRHTQPRRLSGQAERGTNVGALFGRRGFGPVFANLGGRAFCLSRSEGVGREGESDSKESSELEELHGEDKKYCSE